MHKDYQQTQWKAYFWVQLTQTHANSVPTVNDPALLNKYK